MELDPKVLFCQWNSTSVCFDYLKGYCPWFLPPTADIRLATPLCSSAIDPKAQNFKGLHGHSKRNGMEVPLHQLYSTSSILDSVHGYC